MSNLDDLLQKKLEAIESGAPLETVLQDLPEEIRGELEGLLRLAAAVRTVPHPEPEADQVQIQRAQVRAAAERNTRPTQRQPRHLPGQMPEPLPGQPAANPFAQWLSSRWKWLGAGALLTAAAGTVALFALILLGAGLWLSSRGASAARVEYMNGQVQVAANASGTQWKNISTGYQLHRGDRLRTLGASSATLVFFEGTHTFVSPNSDLTFVELHGSSRSTLQVKIDEKSGETWNKVTPFKGNTQSYFLVQTPSGTASVHGTDFNVKVSQDGQAHFAVNTGEVWVKNSSSEVTLQAGQATTANPNGAIAAPTYLFSVQGSLTAKDDPNGIWTVSGVNVLVTQWTVISGAPNFGDTIKVSGRVLEDNSWIADTIEPGADDDQDAYFTGKLEETGSEAWKISGKTVQVNADTQIDAHLAAGDPVKVTYNILDDGTWLALKIENLLETPVEPTPTPTATSDPRAMPSYEFNPDEVETQACGKNDFNLAGSLKNAASAAKDYAANVQLDYQIDSGGEYVSSVELAPASWTRIEAGQTVAFTARVVMNEKWAALVGQNNQDDGTQVKLRVFVASATNRPDHLNGRVTMTITSGCKENPTASGTPTVTSTTTQTPETPGDQNTPTVAPTATTAPENQGAGQCVGANPQPTGQKLAQRYNVSYEEIMGWFCQNYGFGEIDLAYSLSHESGVPVEKIFAMRAQGMGWGEIKKALQKNSGGEDNKDNKGNKGKDNGKGGKKDK